MLPRLRTVLATGVFTLALLGPVTAVADDREVTGPSLPEQASATGREHAEAALARAQALFSGRSPAAAGRDATMVLNELFRLRDELSPADRQRADALLSRPTTPGGDGYVDYVPNEEPPHCGVVICIHYVATTDDAPPMTDGDGDGVPDSVEQVLANAERVHDTYVAAGYLRPDGDGRDGGGRNLVDIYLADVGAQGLYGYCTSDPDETGWHVAAYCVIDDDFASDQFRRHTPLENQQVTLAHEYFHAVQFAYDAYEDPWFMEATATWAEDEVFDDINDNRSYLRKGQLKRPGIPLDESAGDLNVYGNWIFFRYLTERWPDETGTLPTLVRELTEKTSARAEHEPDMFSTQAIHSALAERGTSFTTVYGDFADANRRPAAEYEEGAAYPKASTSGTWRLSTSRRSTGAASRRLDHLTNLALRFKPDASLSKPDWRLRLTVDMPPAATAPVARVATYLKSGEVDTSTIRLKATGSSRKVVGFSAGQVRYVELVLVNASRRSNCWSADWTYACMGTPRDDNERTDFSASIFRR